MFHLSLQMYAGTSHSTLPTEISLALSRKTWPFLEGKKKHTELFREQHTVKSSSFIRNFMKHKRRLERCLRGQGNLICKADALSPQCLCKKPEAVVGSQCAKQKAEIELSGSSQASWLKYAVHKQERSCLNRMKEENPLLKVTSMWHTHAHSLTHAACIKNNPGYFRHQNIRRNILLFLNEIARTHTHVQ